MTLQHTSSSPRGLPPRARHDAPLQRTTALEEAAELTAAILESFPGYVALLDATGHIFAANGPWIALFRERGAQCIAAADVGDNYAATLKQLASNGHECAVQLSAGLEELLGRRAPNGRIELTCGTPDGRQVAVVGLALERPAGGAAFTAVDITPWATSARALQQAQRDLTHAASLAVAGELVGGITHDLRQPLTSLKMNLDTVSYLLEQDPPQTARAAAVIADAGADANAMRDSVQLLEDLVTHRQPMRAIVSIESVVNDVTRLLHSEAQARHVKLEVAWAVPLPPVYVDRSMVREAVLGLVLDAIENADAGQDSRVQLRANVTGESVELCVAHRRRDGRSIDDGWVLSVARTVADAHHATLRLDDRAGDVCVTINWPTAGDFAVAGA